MWLSRVSISLQALSQVRQTKKLSFLWTLIWLPKPSVDSCTLSVKEHELPKSCCDRFCVKRVIDRLLLWDFIWLARAGVDKQTLLQMLQTCSNWKVSGTEIERSLQSVRFRLERLIHHASDALQLSWIGGGLGGVMLIDSLCFKCFTATVDRGGLGGRVHVDRFIVVRSQSPLSECHEVVFDHIQKYIS